MSEVVATVTIIGLGSLYFGLYLARKYLCNKKSVNKNPINKTRYTKTRIVGRDKQVYDSQTNEWLMWYLVFDSIDDFNYVHAQDVKEIASGYESVKVNNQDTPPYSDSYDRHNSQPSYKSSSSYDDGSYDSGSSWSSSSSSSSSSFD